MREDAYILQRMRRGLRSLRTRARDALAAGQERRQPPAGAIETGAGCAEIAADCRELPDRCQLINLRCSHRPWPELPGGDAGPVPENAAAAVEPGEALPDAVAGDGPVLELSIHDGLGKRDAGSKERMCRELQRCAKTGALKLLKTDKCSLDEAGRKQPGMESEQIIL